MTPLILTFQIASRGGIRETRFGQKHRVGMFLKHVGNLLNNKNKKKKT